MWNLVTEFEVTQFSLIVKCKIIASKLHRNSITNNKNQFKIKPYLHID